MDAYVASHPFFRGLEPDQQRRVAEHAVLRPLERDEILGLEGEPCVAVYFVVEGAIRALKLSPHGREQTVNHLGVGEPFYLVPALDGGALPVSTQAAMRAVVLSFDRTDFVQMLERYPGIARHILRAFAQRLRQMGSLVEDLALRTVPQRLAGLLLQQVDTPSPGGAPRRMTQREMAARLGTVREVIGRTLRQFEEKGWAHVHRGVIEITDPDELRAIAWNE